MIFFRNVAGLFLLGQFSWFYGRRDFSPYTRISLDFNNLGRIVFDFAHPGFAAHAETKVHSGDIL